MSKKLHRNAQESQETQQQDKEMLKLEREIKKLEEIKQKAQEHNLKPTDAQFLIMLEKQCSNISFDHKIDQTNKKRLKIIDEIEKDKKVCSDE